MLMKLENEPCVKLLKLAILSHYVIHEEDKSVSLILIANPELDKTRVLKRFFDIKGVSIQSDITYLGIMRHILPKIASDTIKTIIIPDLLKPIMKKQATKDNFITILNALIEEGVYEITLRDSINYDGARCNILTSITPDLFFNNKFKWNKMGFLSRFLPITYTYTSQKTEEVLKAIETGNVPEPEPIDLKLPEFKTEVELPEKIAHQLRPIVEKLLNDEIGRKKLKDKIISTQKGQGFRHQHQLQSLLRANALYREDNKVRAIDLKEIQRLSNWINYSFNIL